MKMNSVGFGTSGSRLLACVSGKLARFNFYRGERQGVPVTAVFNSGIVNRLPRPKEVEITLVRLFGGNE